MSSTAPPSTHRLDHLDAVRGLAAIAVVCTHYTSAYGVPYTPWLLMSTPLRAWFDGLSAVSLFFVLSGLVLSIRHFRDTPHPRLVGFDYVGFLIGRACRIGLPYWAVLALSAGLWHLSAVNIHGGPPVTPWTSNLWRDAPTVAGVIRQANLLSLATHFSLVPQAWTLAIEVILSALVPVAVLVAARGTGWLLGATAVACLMGGLNEYALHFAVGVALAKHYRAAVAWLEPRSAARAGLAVAGWVAYTWRDLAVSRGGLHLGHVDDYASGLGAAILLMTGSASPGLRRWLAQGITHRIGRASYSLYLSHFLVLLCLSPRLMAFLTRHLHVWVATWGVGLVVTIATSVALAEVVYWTVEVPSMAIGKRAATAVASLWARPPERTVRLATRRPHATS